MYILVAVAAAVLQTLSTYSNLDANLSYVQKTFDLSAYAGQTIKIYFIGQGREPGRDPYFRHLYRIGMDGRGLMLLTPENADHTVSLSSGESSARDYIWAMTVDATASSAPPIGSKNVGPPVADSSSSSIGFSAVWPQ